MRITRWGIVLGSTPALALAACRSETQGLSAGCVESCQEAISVGGVPCAFDAPGAKAYDAFRTCAEQIPDGGVCDSVFAQGPPSPECIVAIEALPPPCSSTPGTCSQN